jgi:hypothetical protein
MNVENLSLQMLTRIYEWAEKDKQHGLRLLLERYWTDMCDADFCIKARRFVQLREQANSEHPAAFFDPALYDKWCNDAELMRRIRFHEVDCSTIAGIVERLNTQNG